MSHDPAFKRRLRFVALTVVFIDLVSAGILIPIQPFFAESLGARPAVVTALEASYAGMQFLLVPVWGRMSDRHGRRPLVVWSLLASVFGLGLLGIADSLAMAFAGRMLAGFGNATMALAAAALADRSAPSERAGEMGRVGAAMGLGMLLGAAMGGLLLGPLGLRAPILISAALSGAAAILAVTAWPETSPRLPSSGPLATVLSPSALREANKWPGFVACLAVFGVAAASTAIFQQATPLLLEHGFLLNEPDPHAAGAAATAVLLVCYGLMLIAVQGFVVPWLAPRVGEPKMVRGGLALVAVGLLGLASTPLWAPTWWLTIPICLVHGLGVSLSVPTLFGLASRLAPDADQGRAIGLAQSMVALGRVLGPALAGVLFEVALPVPFLVAAALTTTACALAFRLK